MEEYVTEAFHRLPDTIPTTARPLIDRPKHVINICRAVNDTEIPALTLDMKRRELSFDWRGMYARFYAEEKLFEMHQKHWVRTELLSLRSAMTDCDVP